jgi:sec-independent protein translocase protein TatC
MTKRNKKNHENRLKPHNPKIPFIEHVFELRKRVFYIVLSIGLWAAAAYTVQQSIVGALLKPAHNQQFIYTSVGGGIDFLLRVCVYAGVFCSIPIIVYQTLQYLRPLVKKDSVRFIGRASIASGTLAVAGILFGYSVGLPPALHFLLHQFTSDQIHPLLTIQSYVSFVTLYLLGSALLFQLPLVLILINRITPLSPKRLLGYERWVILAAFVLGGIMNPSPRIQDQLLLAIPIIAAYQIGILLIWKVNKRSKRSKRVTQLLEKDAELRAERLTRFETAQTARRQKALAAQATTAQPPVVISPAPQPRTTASTRRYANDFSSRRIAMSRSTALQI